MKNPFQTIYQAVFRKSNSGKKIAQFAYQAGVKPSIRRIAPLLRLPPQRNTYLVKRRPRYAGLSHLPFDALPDLTPSSAIRTISACFPSGTSHHRLLHQRRRARQRPPAVGQMVQGFSGGRPLKWMLSFVGCSLLFANGSQTNNRPRQQRSPES